jgi:hypothetical protein
MRRPTALFFATFVLAANPSFGQEEPPDLTTYENLTTQIEIDVSFTRAIILEMFTVDENAPIDEATQDEFKSIFTRAKAVFRDLEAEEDLLDEEIPAWASKCATEETCDEAMVHITTYAVMRVESAQIVNEMKGIIMIAEFALAADQRLSN